MLTKDIQTGHAMSFHEFIEMKNNITQILEESIVAKIIPTIIGMFNREENIRCHKGRTQINPIIITQILKADLEGTNKQWNTL